jgi:hypothetical protein
MYEGRIISYLSVKHLRINLTQGTFFLIKNANPARAKAENQTKIFLFYRILRRFSTKNIQN